MKRNVNNCTGMGTKLAELLLDPEHASDKVKAHVAECGSCRRDLEELRATMNLLDAWQVPEPGPYFMTRMSARLGEEREAPRMGWLGRLRARLAYGSPMNAKPLAAMALTIALLLGGGAYLGITNWEAPPVPAGQADVVHDLQMLENNAQLLDQLEAISSTDQSSTDSN
ncbi:MAG TPA: hypothetical protein VFI20_07345 [Terracidiphilus sp.]|nr:hypothetical protein [Terracidiphilus sp.]